MSQQSAFEYLKHGQTPFFRLPARTADFPARSAVLMGVPYDGGTTYQPGARLAPYHIRRVSAFFQNVHPVHKIAVFDEIEAFDGGNVTVPPFDDAAARDVITQSVGGVAQAGALPFLVGGDHSIALPAMRALYAQHGPLAVVHVDAHLDVSTAEAWGADFHHGTPMRHALTEGLIADGQLFQLGIRATWSHLEEAQINLSQGGTILDPDTLCAELGSQMATIREKIGKRPVYVSFDIDAVDPAFAPGTGTPVAGGLSSREAIRLLRELAGVNLVGMDMVEVAPNLDVADTTSILASQLLYEGLALVALKQG